MRGHLTLTVYLVSYKLSKGDNQYQKVTTALRGENHSQSDKSNCVLLHLFTKPNIRIGKSGRAAFNV